VLRGVGDMHRKRILRHLLAPAMSVRRALPRSASDAIERTVREVEAACAGQVRVAVEGALGLRPLLRGQSARERAVEVFSELRVWDTERNNGVLIYLLLADRDVEIVADRGIHGRVGTEGWEPICRDMEKAFQAGRFEQGLIAGIRAVGRHLCSHFPGVAPGPNELPDRPELSPRA
jgi:uncharacterized membrane protein